MKSRLVTAAALALWSQIALAATPTAQLTGQVRLVKSDGKTVLAQAAPLLVSPAGTAAGKLPEITVSDKDAFLTALGRCAFNLQYDEVSATAVAGSTNRLYSNDALIAQNTQITLEPKAVKTIWTQPYLVAGANNVRLVINADSGAPSTGWVRIHVTGTCGKPAAAGLHPADGRRRLEPPEQRLGLQQLRGDPAPGPRLREVRRPGALECRDQRGHQGQEDRECRLRLADGGMECPAC